MSHRDSIGITHRDKIYPVAVQQERDKPTVGGLSVPLRPGQKSLLKSRIGINLPGRLPSPPSYSVRGVENNRRAWCQQKAIFRLYSLDDGRTPFSDILEALVRRWPVSVGGDQQFIARLQFIYDREQAARLRPTPGEEKLEREALSYHAAGSPWSAFWYRYARHVRIAAGDDPQRLQLLVARLRAIVAGDGTTENQGAGPGGPAAPAVLSSLPPLPPLASRPLEAIHRMAGAPLDLDEEAAR